MTKKRTSLQIYELTKKELVRVRGELEAQNGNQRSFNNVIRELIEFWREHHSKNV